MALARQKRWPKDQPTIKQNPFILSVGRGFSPTKMLDLKTNLHFEADYKSRLEPTDLLNILKNNLITEKH